MQTFVEKMNLQMLDAVLQTEMFSFDDPWSRSMFEEELSNPLAFYTVAKVQGKIVGYCGFWAVLDEGHITNIATHPDFRRCGVAKSLIKNMIQTAKHKRLSFLTLEVRQSNHAAQSLYASFGFEAVGLRKKYYDGKEDAVLMTLFLKQSDCNKN